MIKKSLYALAGASLLVLNTANAAINTGEPVVDPNLVTAGTADVVIQRWVSNILGFLYLAAVLYGLWGGFNILTAGGDEKKVETGKKVIMNALIGIVVIFLVGAVVNLLINTILT